MNMESTFTSVVSIISMMYMTADRACLTRISRIYVLNFDAFKSGFVFYVLCKSIE